MSKMQIEKGKEGERELARLLRSLLGETITRNLQQSRDGGGDLHGTRFALEVKRAKVPRLNEWWQQACDQAAKVNRTPCLVYRLNRQHWRFMLPLGALHPDHDPTDHGLTAIIGLLEFVTIAQADADDQRRHDHGLYHQNPARTEEDGYAHPTTPLQG